MAEHVLRGEIAIYPRAEGGRQLIVNDLGEIYRIPLPEESVKAVERDLGLSDEELIESIERRRTAQESLVAPNGGGRPTLITP